MGFLSDNIADKTILGAIADTGADPHEWYKKAGLMQGLGRLAGQYVVDPVAQAAPSINKGMTGQQLTPYDVANTFGLLADVGATTSVASGLMGGVKPNVVNSIPAWHGSPHRIDPKVGFMDEAIGTGEGAQAFGYGHYFTDDRGIAEGYSKLGKTDLTDVGIKGLPLYKNGEPVDYSALKSGEHLATLQEDLLIDEWMFKQDKEPKEILKDVQKWFDDQIDYYKEEMNFNPEDSKYYKERLKTVQKYKPKTEKDLLLDREFNNNLYRTTIHKGKDPSEYNYLEWDKRLDEQPKKIQEILKNADFEEATNIKRLLDGEELPDFVKDFIPQTGEGIYNSLKREFNRYPKADFGDPFAPKQASKFLKQAGIDGIKYPAGTLSGGNKNNAFNYVVFDPKDITIDEHYVNGLMQPLGGK